MRKCYHCSQIYPDSLGGPISIGDATTNIIPKILTIAITASLNSCDISGVIGPKGAGTLTSNQGATTKVVTLNQLSDGSISATMAVNGAGSQIITSSNAEVGAGLSIEFAAGSFAVPSLVTLSPANSLANSSTLAELGGSSTQSLAAAGNAFTISSSLGSSTQKDLTNPFQLSDLITVSGWTNNRVTVTKGGVTTVQSSLAVWWTNTVMAAPSAAATRQDLNTSGIIYYVSDSSSRYGYTVTADKVALVGLTKVTS